MRTYLILKDKAERWNNHPEIKALLAEIAETNNSMEPIGKFDKKNASSLLAQNFDRIALSANGLKYERLDQLTMDILFGVE